MFLVVVAICLKGMSIPECRDDPVAVYEIATSATTQACVLAASIFFGGMPDAIQATHYELVFCHAIKSGERGA